MTNRRIRIFAALAAAAIVFAAIPQVRRAAAQQAMGAYASFRRQSVPPANPPAGSVYVWVNDATGNVSATNSSGVTANLGGGSVASNYQTLQSAGVDQNQRAKANFSSAFTLSDSASPSVTTIGLAGTIAGGSCTNCSLTYNASGQVTVAANGTGGAVSLTCTSPAVCTPSPITGTGVISHAAVGTAGSYGSATSIPVLTTNATGHVSNVVATAIAGLAQSAVTNLVSDLAAKLPLAGGVMSGAITLSGTQIGTYSLGGTPTLAAGLAVASGVDITAVGGVSDLNYSASSGAWTSPTGGLVVSGADLTLASGVDILSNGGVANFDFSSSSGTFATPTGAATFNATTNTIVGNVVFGNAAAHTISTTTSAGGVVGRSLSISAGAAGAAGGNGGDIGLTGGTGAGGANGLIRLMSTVCGGVSEGTCGDLTVGGAVNWLANKALTMSAGTGSVDFSLGTGIFTTTTGANTLSGNVTISGSKTLTTGTGAVTINGGVSIASGVDEVAAGGVSDFDWSLSSGVLKTPTGAHTFGSASWAVPANTVITGSSSATNTTGLKLVSNTTDGASSKGVVINNTAALSSGWGLELQDAGTAFLQARNRSSGGFELGGAGSSTAVYIHNGTANEYINMTGGTISVAVGGATRVAIESGGVHPNTDFGVGDGDTTHRYTAVHSRHYSSGQSAVPTCVAGTGAGISGSPTCTISAHGTDTAGVLSITTATSPAASGATIATITLNTAVTLSTGPYCTFIDTGSNASVLNTTLTTITPDPTAGSTTTWVLKNYGATGLAGATTYTGLYHCFDSSL